MSTILITGAAGGIGAACARRLAPDHRLILAGRDTARLQALRRSLHGDHAVVAADLSEAAGITAVAAAASGGIDVLVNNAGAFSLASCEAIDAQHLERLWRINVVAPMLLTAACLPHIRDGGCIVNVSSTAVDNAFAGCAAYTACKCALEGWSRVLREELRPRRIRVGIIAPGATDTPVWPAGTPDAARARMMAADDIAAAMALMVGMPVAAAVDRVAITPSAGPL